MKVFCTKSAKRTRRRFWSLSLSPFFCRLPKTSKEMLRNPRQDLVNVELLSVSELYTYLYFIERKVAFLTKIITYNHMLQLLLLNNINTLKVITSGDSFRTNKNFNLPQEKNNVLAEVLNTLQEQWARTMKRKSAAQ